MNLSRERLIYLGILILALTAIVLGALIYNQSRMKFSLPSLTQTDTQSSTSSTNNINKESSSVEEVIRNFPPENATDEEKAKHFAAVNTLAQEGDRLEINDCQVSPPILKVKNKQNFQIVNTGDTDQAIYVTKEYNIPAGQTITVTADFGHGVGTYGYGCQSIPNSLIGIILVTD